MRTREEVQEEQRKADARVQRWNESVAKVQALAARWQQEELARLPNKVLLHPVNEESWLVGQRMSHLVWYTIRMIIKTDMTEETLKPLFDLDGTLIKEMRESNRLFDFTNPAAILNLEESDLTPLGKLVRDSGKHVDILTARGNDGAWFIRVALEKLNFNVGRVITVGIDVNEPADWAKVSSKRVVERKQRIVKWVMRKLVDNDPRNLDGLGELGELVTQDQKEF